MTVTKESLRRIVKFYDENDEAFYVPDIPIYVAAARFVERLLPAPCDKKGCVEKLHWDEGLVEVVAQALLRNNHPFLGDGHLATLWKGNADHYKREAVAALRAIVSALTQQVGT